MIREEGIIIKSGEFIKMSIIFENKKLNKKLAKLNDAPIMDRRTKLLISLGAEINFPEMIILYSELHTA